MLYIKKKKKKKKDKICWKLGSYLIHSNSNSCDGNKTYKQVSCQTLCWVKIN